MCPSPRSRCSRSKLRRVPLSARRSVATRPNYASSAANLWDKSHMTESVQRILIHRALDGTAPSFAGGHHALRRRNGSRVECRPDAVCVGRTPSSSPPTRLPASTSARRLRSLQRTPHPTSSSRSHIHRTPCQVTHYDLLDVRLHLGVELRRQVPHQIVARTQLNSSSCCSASGTSPSSRASKRSGNLSANCRMRSSIGPALGMP